MIQTRGMNALVDATSLIIRRKMEQLDTELGGRPEEMPEPDWQEALLKKATLPVMSGIGKLAVHQILASIPGRTTND